MWLAFLKMGRKEQVPPRLGSLGKCKSPLSVAAVGAPQTQVPLEPSCVWAWASAPGQEMPGSMGTASLRPLQAKEQGGNWGPGSLSLSAGTYQVAVRLYSFPLGPPWPGSHMQLSIRT